MLPTAMWAIQILKLSSCGLTMYIYLNYNYLWLGGVILLPLIAMVIERLIKESSGKSYFFFLFCNYFEFLCGIYFCLFFVWKYFRKAVCSNGFASGNISDATEQVTKYNGYKAILYKYKYYCYLCCNNFCDLENG